MNENFYIYFLLDPRTERYEKGGYALPHEPFYVGKGKGTRCEYLNDRNNWVRNKVQSIKKNGYDVECVKIGSYSENEALVVEKEFIKTFGRKFLDEGSLLNIQEGGQGSFSHINDNPNHVVWNKGQKHPEATRQKISRAMKGKMAGDKHNSKRLEVRSKISRSLMGHPVSEATREKLRCHAKIQWIFRKGTEL